MPLENSHTARQLDPAKCAQFRQQNDVFGPGIDVVWCVNKGKPVEPQSIHFDKTKFTPEEAKKWLEKHSYSAADFVPAAGTQASAAALVADGAVMKDVSQCPMGADCPMAQDDDAAAAACAAKAKAAKAPPPPAVRVVNLAAEGLPCSLQLSSGDLEIQAAAASNGITKRAFAATSYTGVGMRLEGFAHPVVVDLAGMKIPSQKMPVLRQHDPERPVGHTTVAETSAQRLRNAGFLHDVTAAGKESLALIAAEFPFQVSLGADVQKMEFVDKGASAKANGRNFEGPVYVARGTTLREISLVPMGADANTSATVEGVAAAPDLQAAFHHNSETSPDEPDWAGVDKTALPALAFADHAGQQSQWSFPHHWVQNAGGKDKDGNWTTGTLLLHKGGLNAAWAAAQGAHTGKKADAAVIAHLEMHRKAIGLDKKD